MKWDAEDAYQAWCSLLCVLLGLALLWTAVMVVLSVAGVV